MLCRYNVYSGSGSGGSCGESAGNKPINTLKPSGNLGNSSVSANNSCGINIHVDCDKKNYKSPHLTVELLYRYYKLCCCGILV
jgi:hypothetical protein